MTMSNDTAIVLVTYNRLALLKQCLESLCKQSHQPNHIFIINNASTDSTASYLSEIDDKNITIVNNEINTGGAGGFRQGLLLAYERGYDWMLLIDDDIYLDPGCLEKLLAYEKPVSIAVRENKEGRVVEMAAIEFNLKDFFILKPKKKAVFEVYQNRSEMPAVLPVENVSFEGFFIHRDVVESVGFPDDSYFIFYDDVDYALRIRRSGRKIFAIRDAKIMRQLPYNKSDTLSSWKNYYMYRNFFRIHYKYGETFLVRRKPVFYFMAGIISGLFRLKFERLSSIFRAFSDYKK